MNNEFKLDFGNKDLSPKELKKENMDLLIERESIRLRLNNIIEKIDEELNE